jgi:TRAP-type transport system small permease protein
MTLFFRLSRALSQLALTVAVLALIVVTAVVGWQVFGRYVLNDTPVWAERVSLLLMIYLCLLGAAVAVRDAGHLGMEFMLTKLTESSKRRLAYFIHWLTLAFGVAMAWYGVELAAIVRTHAIPTLGISEAWTYVPLGVSGVLIVLFCAEHIACFHLGADVTPTFAAHE